MADSEKSKGTAKEAEGLAVSSTAPLVFISHDSRDAELAEAFSKLLKSVSAGMLKCFRSSDKKGSEGFQFGDEWYNRLMEKLQSATEVVCLFTQRSIDRPWILYEAGVAKAKLESRVRAIAFGVPLTKLQTGPFFHFQNLENTEEALRKLVRELAQRVPGLEPDADVIDTQVKTFKAASDKIVEEISHQGEGENTAEDDPQAKFLEEMKVLIRELPSRVSERLDGEPSRRRRFRRFHPMMFEEMMHIGGEEGDPIGILLAASVVRDELPWFYEIAQEAYHAIRSGDVETAEQEIRRIHHMAKMLVHGPFMEELGTKEMHMVMMELPRMLEHTLHRCIEIKKATKRRKSLHAPKEEV
jgi:hypothetical protein